MPAEPRFTVTVTISTVFAVSCAGFVLGGVLSCVGFVCALTGWLTLLWDAHLSVRAAWLPPSLTSWVAPLCRLPCTNSLVSFYCFKCWCCSVVVMSCWFAGCLYFGSSFPSYVAIFISHVFSLPLRSLSSLPPFSPSLAVVVLGFHVGGGREGGGWGARNPSLACGVSPPQARLFFLFRTAGWRAEPF